ncbi:P-loop ATPase, Sll1717 family [Actinophytocola sediminis]
MTDLLDVVSGLYFGRDDAEHDAVDGLLRHGFLATSAFEEALWGRKSLIIGRKGSGKSAICMRLAMPEVTQGNHLLITPDDTAAGQLRGFELAGLTSEAAKSLIWRYVFAIHIARYLVDRHARRVHDRREPKSVKRVRRFLRANGELAEARLPNRIAMAAKGLRGSLALGAFGMSLSADFGTASEGVRAAEQLAIIERGVATAVTDLGCAEAHQPLLLLVDKLEHIWPAEPDNEALITGLLVAGKHVAHSYGRAARTVVFLRSDIYDSLTFSEADKFRSDEIRIDWSREQLVELAVTRATASLGHHVTSDYLWGTVFPATVDGEPVVDYLFSRMLPRPRDAIQFLNLCRDTARGAGHDRILEQDVINATFGFSRWKTLDLVREFSSTLPFLERVLAMFQNGDLIVTRDTMARHLAEFGDALRAQFPRFAAALTPDGLTEVLYRVGFLGIRRGGDITYITNAALPIQPDENEFHVHPCFRPALTLQPRPTELVHYHPVQKAVVLGNLPSGNVYMGNADVWVSPSDED